MSTLKPTSPDGQPHTVGVPLLPWEPRLREGKVGRRKLGGRATREVGDGLVDVATWGPADLFDDLAVAAIVIGLGLLLFWFGGWLLPFAILAVELVLAAVLFVGLGIGRTVARRPWPVHVRSGLGPVADYQVVGYRRARRAAQALSAMITRGEPLPTSGAFDPDTID